MDEGADREVDVFGKGRTGQVIIEVVDVWFVLSQCGCSIVHIVVWLHVYVSLNPLSM